MLPAVLFRGRMKSRHSAGAAGRATPAAFIQDKDEGGVRPFRPRKVAGRLAFAAALWASKKERTLRNHWLRGVLFVLEAGLEPAQPSLAKGF